MNTTVVIFDGDDTLWETQPLYERAMQQFGALLAETLDIPSGGVREMFLKIDSANVPVHGFGPRRFRISMRMLYQGFCAQARETPDPGTLWQIDRIAETVSTVHAKPISGAKEVLEELSRACRLFLYTLGDREEQRGKAIHLGLDRYFKMIYTTEAKNDHELRRFAAQQQLTPGLSWMVGNSLKSDINPALRLGFQCIWLRSMSWTYDEEDPEPGLLHRVSLLPEVLPLVLGSP